MAAATKPEILTSTLARWGPNIDDAHLATQMLHEALEEAREQGRREARAETASVLRKLADGLSQAADALRILAPDDSEVDEDGEG